MEQDFSWNRAAARYERVYLEAYQRRRGHPFHGYVAVRDDHSGQAA